MANEVFKNDANLKALWLLEEASGTRYDAVGDNDLTDNNTVASSTDFKEGARSADFEDTNSEYLSIADNAALSITGNITVCLWFKPESLTDAADHCLLAKYNTTGNLRSYRICLVNLSNVFYARATLSSDGTAVAHAIGATGLSAGTWYHIAAVYNGTDIRVYLDGVLDTNGTDNPKAYTGGIHNNASPFELGRLINNNRYADGKMDEVAVFDRALSALEIARVKEVGIRNYNTQALAGALTWAGALVRKTWEAVAGTLGWSGTVLAGVANLIALAGTLTPAGTLLAKSMKALAGALTPAGVARKKATETLAGALTFSGAVSEKAVTCHASAGTLTSSGTLTKKAVARNAGAAALTFSGAVTLVDLESLSSFQRNLTVPEPVIQLTIGSHDLSNFVVAYRYEEEGQADGSLALWLDNRDDHFDNLAVDWPDLKRGAAVDLRRGYTIGDSPMTAKLPRTWIDSLQYVFDDGAGMLLLSCIDWWGRLATRRYGTKQTWSNTAIRTVVTAILGQAGLTLMAGAFGFNVTHEVDVNEDLDEALKDLMDKVDEFLYAGLDGEVKFKTLDLDEAAGYVYGWTDEAGVHPLMSDTEIAESSAEYNRVTVNGSGAYTGTAEDTDEIALVGTRQRTITDTSLTSNAQCLERAAGELSFWQARAVAGTLVARPHMTLRLYDVVSVAAPPWGGPALAKARVTGIVERYGFGEWEQEITIGDIPEHSLLHVIQRPGKGRKSSARRKAQKTAKKKKSSRTRYTYAKREHTHKEDDIEDLDHYTLADLLAEDGDGSLLDADLLDGVHLASMLQAANFSGIVAMYSGAIVDIPAGWHLCDGTGGTPDLRGRFIIGAGGAYGVGATGGAATANLAHTHGPGSLNTASDSHTHTPGSLVTDSKAHTHGPGSLTPTGANSAATLFDTNYDHYTTNGSTNGHTHSLSGATGSTSHSHDVTGTSASDSHDHDVDSGVTASGGSAAQSILPPYYALAFVMWVGT